MMEVVCTIAATFTVRATDEAEAREILSLVIQKALEGEPNPVEDFSIDATLEVEPVYLDTPPPKTSGV